MPVCFPSGATSGGSAPAKIALVGVTVHSAAMLAVTATMACMVHEWLGIGILRRVWINLDAVWTVALLAAGAMLVTTSL
jgi:hypothetical protein